MTRAILTITFLTMVTARFAGAAEPVVDPQAGPSGKTAGDMPTNSLQPVVPQRELVFEVSEQPAPFGWRAPAGYVPQTGEFRYVAYIRMVVPIIQSGRFRSRDSAPVDWLSTVPFSRRATLDALVQSMPDERRPSEDVVSDLSRSMTASVNVPFCLVVDPRDARRRDLSGGFGPPSTDDQESDTAEATFRIFAPTEERAKQLAREWLNIMDYGACYVKQQESVRQKEASEARLAERRGLLAEKREELVEPQKKLQELDEVADLDAETLAQIITQQRLIGVELAGVTARLEACERLLKIKAANKARHDQVDELKVTAEIELVGLTARKQALDEIVRKGQARVELAAKVITIRNSIASGERRVSSYEAEAAEYESLRQANMPFPVQGAITIQPVKWQLHGR